MRKLLFLLFVFGGGLTASGQSTFGTVGGTVRDPSGAAVPNATLVLHRAESNTDRTVTSDAAGQYNALNLDPGTYSLRATAAGFTAATATGLHLDVRQQLLYDVSLSIAGTESVTVNATDVGTITTDNASIASSLSPQEVLDLPANYRGAGSTSPLNLVQALPGVQPDSGAYPPAPSTHPVPAVRFSIQGGLPSQTETTVDGISAQNQTSNNVQADAFPSADAIAEIRVDGVNNNAEFGQPGEITTVTKAGSNQVHGRVYDYLQNQFLDATPYGAIKPHKVANDFGASIGAPLFIPHLYNGRNRTFVFGAYEGLRFPQTTPIQAKVPTALMKQGNLSQETSKPLVNPFNGTNYAGNIVPINASSAPFLQFYPDPNVDANLSLTDAIADRGYNYLSTRRNDIFSNQFDVRVDENLGSKATVFGRYTFKNNNQTQAADLTLPYTSSYATYRIFAGSFNYAFTSHLANEFRFGFTLEEDGTSNAFNGAAFTTSTGLNIPTLPAFFNGTPHLNFDDNGIQSVGARLDGAERSRLYQYVDNVTYQLNSHTIRLGTDIRHLLAHSVAGSVTPSINYGDFIFDPQHSATGNEWADFLVGVPYQNQLNHITQDNDAAANAYAFYAQDNWKATQNLNLNFGLRYEYHPALAATNGLTGNFDPSIPGTGRLIYPTGYANTLDVQELANVNACPTAGVNNPYATGQAINGVPCTPVVDNVTAGVSPGLRNVPKLRFMPRLGVAYRPFGNDRTAIRAGMGYYNITTTGALFYAIAQTLQENYQAITNTYSPTGPTFAFPNTTASGQFVPSPGSVYFYSAIDTKWRDPYSLQTDVSVDHDFGHNIGGRISYIGMHTWHLVWQPQFNQLPASTTRVSSSVPQTAYQFPNFYQITDRNTAAQSDYRSLQAEISHRLANGLSFDSAYTFAKNLADNQGSYGNFNSAGFVDEQGGYSATDSFNRHLDYGNVTGTRRHRSLTTVVYQLPIGRGKRFGSGMNRWADALVGGWQTSNIFLWQSGPFLTAFFDPGYIDPSGTGSGTLVGGAAQRPDRVGNAISGTHDRNHWFNNDAFACPGGRDRLGNTGFASISSGQCDVGTIYTDPVTKVQTPILPIGRYGTESVGDLRGPGTVNLSSGLSKTFAVTEAVRLRAEGTFTNVLNHTNLADPQTDLTQGNFGQITQSRGSDFGGNRTGQLSVSLEF